MHPNIRIELFRLKQAELRAVAEASRLAAQAGSPRRSRPPLAGGDRSPVLSASGRRRTVNILERLRALRSRVLRTLFSGRPWRYHLELEGAILIRYSRAGDERTLRRLAALDGRRLPEGSFLLVEVDGDVVAAAPLDVDAEPVKDPFRPTANVTELLGLQARYVRRHRDSLGGRESMAPRTVPDAA